MKRETSNVIRTVIEDWLPPAVRDSWMFRTAARLAWGRHIDALAEFRRRAAVLTRAEYRSLYMAHPRVHGRTDNSTARIAQIAQDVVGISVCDIGCGTGYLLREVERRRGGAFARLAGVDFVRPEGLDTSGIDFIEAPIEHVPFADRAFDTVICTHVIEHILDYRAAIAELRRIANRRLIIVVPAEREGIYTFNPHFNFFSYVHSFLRAMSPLPVVFSAKMVGRDIYYVEDRLGTAGDPGESGDYTTPQ
jgi:SAM-dependent methyltransferase